MGKYGMARNLKVISVPAPAMCSRPCGRAPSGNRGGTRLNLMSFAPCDGGMMRGRLCGSEKNAKTLGTGTGIHCSMCKRWLMALGDRGRCATQRLYRYAQWFPNFRGCGLRPQRLLARSIRFYSACLAGRIIRLDCRVNTDNLGFLPELTRRERQRIAAVNAKCCGRVCQRAQPVVVSQVLENFHRKMQIST